MTLTPYIDATLLLFIGVGNSDLTTPSTLPDDSELTTLSTQQEQVKQALSHDDQSGISGTQYMYCVYVLYQILLHITWHCSSLWARGSIAHM